MATLLRADGKKNCYCSHQLVSGGNIPLLAQVAVHSAVYSDSRQVAPLNFYSALIQVYGGGIHPLLYVGGLHSAQGVDTTHDPVAGDLQVVH